MTMLVVDAAAFALRYAVFVLNIYTRLQHLDNDKYGPENQFRMNQNMVPNGGNAWILNKFMKSNF